MKDFLNKLWEGFEKDAPFLIIWLTIANLLNWFIGVDSTKHNLIFITVWIMIESLDIKYNISDKFKNYLKNKFKK